MSTFNDVATAMVREVERLHKRMGLKDRPIPIRFLQTGNPTVYIENGELCLNVFELFERPARLKEDQSPIWLVFEEKGGVSGTFGPIQRGQLQSLFNPQLDALTRRISQLGGQLPFPTSKQIKGKISEVLARRHLGMLLCKYAGSWLNGGGLSSLIVRRGIERYFFHRFAPITTVSLSVWTQYENDTGAYRWLQEEGGCTLVAPLLKDFGSEGIHWLIANQPSENNSERVSVLPTYIEQGLEELNETSTS